MDNNLDLKKFLWKKRLLLIRHNHKNYLQIKNFLKEEEDKIIKNKIEYFFLNHNFSSDIVLIGLDGQTKYESNTFDLKKIFDLISRMPLANY